MTPVFRKAAAQLGYDRPAQLLKRTAWTSATLALATVAGKCFATDLHVKSHFVFGQLTSLTLNLVLYNDHIGKKLDPPRGDGECTGPVNPVKQDSFFVIHYLALSIIPVAIGKLVVSRYFGNITWVQAVKRGAYFGGFGIATLCANGLYQKKKMRLEF